MAQLNRNLAFALGRLYLSWGGSESDLDDVMDSADIVAKLYHLLGGNKATPKGTPMAELVYMLSETQGGGGGASGDINITWTFENQVNDARIRNGSTLVTSLKVDDSATSSNRFRVPFSVNVFVEMEEDSSHGYAFYIEGESISTIVAVASYIDGEYVGVFSNTFFSLTKGNYTFKVVFKQYIENQ